MRTTPDLPCLEAEPACQNGDFVHLLTSFLFFGVLLLLYSSQNFFEMCFALTFISVSLLVVFGSIRAVCLSLSSELRVHADRLIVINLWGFPRTAHIYDFTDVKSVYYDRDGCVALNFFSSIWKIG